MRFQLLFFMIWENYLVNGMNFDFNVQERHMHLFSMYFEYKYKPFSLLTPIRHRSKVNDDITVLPPKTLKTAHRKLPHYINIDSFTTAKHRWETKKLRNPVFAVSFIHINLTINGHLMAIKHKTITSWLYNKWNRRTMTLMFTFE